VTVCGRTTQPVGVACPADHASCCCLVMCGLCCPPGEGFISGYTLLPAECAGLTIRACSRCSSSKDPAKCRQCAKDPALQLGLLEAARTQSLSRSDGCSSCYDSVNPAKCVACLTSNAPCAQCPLLQPNTERGGAVDVSACVDCAQKHGEKFTAACTQCASLGTKLQQVKQCMSCIESLKPLACDLSDYPPPCWNPMQAPSVCATCAASAANFGTCLACLRTSPFSLNCEACASLDASKQDACYKCSKASVHAGSGCADCLTNLKDAAQLQQCVGCLTNLNIGKEGKAWCYGCQNWCGSFDTRAKCVSCLGTPQDAYMSACACP
jgi:hypothetical protein